MTTKFCTILVAILGFALLQADAAQPTMDLSPAEMLKRADADGTVSRDEFIKARTVRLEETFAWMDTNGDGKLDEQEAEAAAALRPAVVRRGWPVAAVSHDADRRVIG